MKRIFGGLTALLCVAVGVIRYFDLANNTNWETGYLLSGGLLYRYLLLAAPVLVIIALAFTVPAKSAFTLPPSLAVLGFCGMLFSGFIGICLYILNYASILELAAAVLMLIGCAWFCIYSFKREATSVIGGFFACAAWLLICGVLFCSKTASLHHLLSVVELLGSLSALLMIAGVLRCAYSFGEKNVARAVCMRGMLAFYFGVCLMLPQELLQWSNGQSVNFLQGKSVAVALLGIGGLIVAIRALGCTEICDDDEDDYEDDEEYEDEDEDEDTDDDEPIRRRVTFQSQSTDAETAVSLDRAIYNAPEHTERNTVSAMDTNDTVEDDTVQAHGQAVVHHTTDYRSAADRLYGTGGAPQSKPDIVPKPASTASTAALGSSTQKDNFPANATPADESTVQQSTKADQSFSTPVSESEKLNRLLQSISADGSDVDPIAQILAEAGVDAASNEPAPSDANASSDGKKWVFRHE